MIVYPAIDILDGRCVRMTAGDFRTAEDVAPDPLSAAKRLVGEGAEWLHVVDLNGARTGKAENLPLIRRIADRFTVRIQAGGGIRDFDAAERFAEAGVSRIVVGTAAVREPELIGRLVDRHADGMAVSVDARGGFVAASGWTETTDVRAADLVHQLAVAGVPTIVYTNVSVDGTLQGVDLRSLEEVARAFGGDVVYSGGVGSLDDVRAVSRLRHRGIRGVIVGRAIYMGRFTLREAIEAAKEPVPAAPEP